MMPELDGFSACREIRKLGDTPIIMLSARGEEYDKINGFEIGIDDYVVKPFSAKELMLRIEAIMKRGAVKHKNTAQQKPVNEHTVLTRRTASSEAPGDHADPVNTADHAPIEWYLVLMLAAGAVMLALSLSLRRRRDR
jgi:DNA-binding response OmpR family regulator